MKRALLFPYPGSYGPLVNCCAVAECLLNKGWKVAFLYAGSNSNIIKDNLKEADIVEANWPPPRLISAWSSKPTFRRMQSMDDFAYIFQFDDYAWASQTLKEQLLFY